MSVITIVRALGIVTITVLALTFTPVPNAVARWVEVEPDLARAEAIVVLGNGIEGDGSLTPRSWLGAVHGVTLFRDGLAPLLVFSGGRSRRTHEAVVRAEIARGMGVPAAAMVLETEAKTTRDEAARIAARLKPRGVQTILLVSTPVHLRRAIPLFERVGFTVRAAPSHQGSSTAASPGERLGLVLALLAEAMAHLYGWVA